MGHPKIFWRWGQLGHLSQIAAGTSDARDDNGGGDFVEGVERIVRDRARSRGAVCCRVNPAPRRTWRDTLSRLRDARLLDVGSALSECLKRELAILLDGAASQGS
jgi:hypothetical protein